MNGTSAPRLLALLCLLLIVCVPPLSAVDINAEAAKNVLVLYSFSDPGLFDPLDNLKAAVRAHVQAPVNFYVEYMETQRFADPGYEKSLSNTLRYAYGVKHLDLVIVVSYPALRFLMKYSKVIAPGVPIVFSYVYPFRSERQKLPPNITGVTNTVDFRGSFDLAFRLQPDTKNVALVIGDTEFDRFGREVFHDAFRPYEDKAKLIDLVALPAAQLLQQVSTLPPHTIVFFQIIPQMSKQPVLGTYDLLAAIGRRLPTYCVFQNYCVGHGGIGGSFADYGEQTKKTGELAGQIFSGEKPESIPVAHDSGARVYVDWWELRRWHIPESALPSGSVVLHRKPTMWGQYKDSIIAGIIVIVFQALLILGLLWQRLKKRQLEASLRESEERFRLITGTAPALIWMCDENGKVTYLNDKWRELTGDEPSAGIGDGFKAYIHPDDLQRMTKELASESRNNVRVMNDGLIPERAEFRLRTRGGTHRWMFNIATPRFLPDGSLAGFIGSAIDVTDQKRAQEELSKLGGRLIEAQEKERARIARDLHDDICQHLIVLSIKLERIMTTSESSPAQIERRTTELEHIRKIQHASQECAEIARSVQALSHELHSSNLDYLGLVGAISGFCEEFSEQHRVAVEFTTANVPDSLPRDSSLCVFRVLQEALRNAIKHSGVLRFEVSLQGSPYEVELEVSDAGVGFDPGTAQATGGLGLVSMRERVQMVKGTISIESKVNGGTRIRISVPVSERDSCVARRNQTPALKPA